MKTPENPEGFDSNDAEVFSSPEFLALEGHLNYAADQPVTEAQFKALMAQENDEHRFFMRTRRLETAGDNIQRYGLYCSYPAMVGTAALLVTAEINALFASVPSEVYIVEGTASVGGGIGYLVLTGIGKYLERIGRHRSSDPRMERP